MLKGYLSWSQLDSFERGQYKKNYIVGDKIPLNRGIVLGKEVADALETGEETGDPIKDLVIAKLPKLDNMDWEYKVEITVGGIVIPLFSKIDTASTDLKAFKEYKTGVTPWNQDKVNKHGQITFYAVVMQALSGKIPADIELVWAPTEKQPDDSVELTGEILRFKTVKTTADMLKMKVRIKKAWLGIGELIAEEII